MRLAELNGLPDEEAARELQRCCGSIRWSILMAARRPFSSAASMADAADAIWWSLDPSDWREAFAAHPRIGDRPADSGRTTAGSGRQAWSAQEQSGVTADSRPRFVGLNRAYEARFGHIFIVCATGKNAVELLDILERRMLNTPEVELREAAEQQRQITRLRLAKLLED